MTERYRRYVDQMTRDSTEYMQQLLVENDRLRTIIGGLEREKTVAERALESVLSEMRSRDSHEASLRQKLEQIEQESRAFADRYVQIEQQNATLANLYVASQQLHVTFDRQTVLAAIKEIIINLIGSEELAIYEISPDGRDLVLVDSFGLHGPTAQRVALGSGVIGSIARSGEVYVISERQSGDPAADPNLTAAIPLKIDGDIIGLVAIYRLLPQKDSLQPVDFELFHLLASHAATALFCAGAYEREKLRGDAA